MKHPGDELASMWQGTVAFVRRHAPYVLLLVFLCAFLAVYFFDRVFISIYPGHLGVLWRRLGGGTVVARTYGEGLHVILPINKMYVYDTRKQRFSESMDVLTLDGLMIHVEYSVRYFPNSDLLPLLHQRVGLDYLKVVVQPEARSVIRTVFGQYKPEEIYTSQKAIQERVSAMAKIRMEARFIEIDDVPIERISLPPKIAEAIEDKLTKHQLVDEYVYRIAVAEQEAVRMEIEANGQKAYNEAIAPTLTPQQLQWQGIQATKELAASPNAKVVVIGQGKSGMPIILGTE